MYFNPSAARRRPPSRSDAVLALCAAVVVLGGCADSGQAPSSEARPSFAGQTVRFIVGVSAGGGQDTYTRVMAPYFARHLPGQPGIVVENMPGAGGLVAATYLARRARPDGLTVGFMSVQAVFAQLLDDSAQFDVRALPLIGSPAADGYVCTFSREAGVTLESWREGGVKKLGITNVGSALAAYALLVSEALGLPVRVVGGYGGTTEIRSAMASGEVDGVCLSRASYLASFQPRDNYAPVLQGGGDRGDAIAGIPLAEEMAASDRARRLLAVAGAAGDLTRFIVLPPKTPEPVVSSLRGAFAQTMIDTEFLAAAKTAQLEIRPRSAAALEAQVRELLSLPDDIRNDVISTLRGDRE